MQSFKGAPCRALVELYTELLAKLLVEPLVERRVELKALHGAPLKLCIELHQSPTRSSARASAKYTPYIHPGSYLIFTLSSLHSPYLRRH